MFYEMEQEKKEGEGEEYTTICPCKRHVVNIYRLCMCDRGLGHCSTPVWLRLSSIMAIFNTLALHIHGFG